MSFKNKKLFSIILSFALVLGILVAPLQDIAFASEGDAVNITVLGTTDVHGNIYNWSYEDGKEKDDLGLAKVYSVVKEVREENPNTILLDNGDMVQGTILTDDLYNTKLDKTHPMIDIMNLMGYDVMTLGNHEFNFGIDLIKKMEKEAEFPILAANATYKKDGSYLTKPYIVKEVAGVKVGILGLTNPNIPRWDASKVTELKFDNMAVAAQKAVKELKEKGKVDIIIATAHAGLDEEYGNDGVKEVIEKCPEIAAILVGHTHGTVNEKVGNTVVGGARDGGRQVVRFDLKLKKDKNTWKVADSKSNIIEVKDYEASEEVIKHAKKYHENTLAFITEVIGTAKEDFQPVNELDDIPEGYIRDTAVIDLINDVQLKYTGADISAAALFKSTSNLKKGDITYASIFDIYKYPNTLLGVEITGKELKNYMEWSAAYYNTYKDGDLTISFNENIRGYKYDMFQGVDYKIDISKPAGQRIVDLKFKGKAVKDDDKFKLALNNYRYDGLKNEGIISGEPYFNSDPKSLRSYIADYIREKGTIEPKVDNNWEIIGADLNSPLRDYVIKQVKDGKIEIPKSEDGRSVNTKSLNIYELAKQGKIPEELLKKHNIEVPKEITIVHTNDTHSRLKEGDYDGMGFAKIATKVKELRSENPNTLLLDAGDTLHGLPIATVSKGDSIVKVMNAMGYDVMVPGNHDFNYGYDRLIELSEKTEFPIVAANVVKEDGTRDLKPYTIKEVDGIKIGIFGLTTPETKYKSNPKNTEGVNIEDPVKVAEEMVKELKKEKVDMIIALSHVGLDEESDVKSSDVAAKVKGIDLIVDGHSHTVLENGKVVGDTLIVQTGEYDKNLGIVNVEFKDGKIVNKTASLFTKEQAAETKEDEEIKALIEEIDKANEEVLSVLVGKTAVKLDGEREQVRGGETNLANIITDAMIKASGAELAITNGGGIRASIETGDITKGDVIKVLPFGNYLVLKEVKGIDILNALEHGVVSYPELAGGFPQVGGMIFKLDPSKEAGKRISDVMIGGKPLDINRTYKLATNDFMAAGGDGYEMLKDGKVLAEYPGLDEIVMEYIKELGTIDKKVEGRMTVVEGKQEEKPVVVPGKEAKEKSYVVKPGDVLWRIAKKFSTTWQRLAEYNKLKNPNLIFPGQKILVPAE